MVNDCAKLALPSKRSPPPLELLESPHCATRVVLKPSTVDMSSTLREAFKDPERLRLFTVPVDCGARLMLSLESRLVLTELSIDH